jgi:hypothetical protein
MVWNIKGHEVIVDDEFYPFLSLYKWHVRQCNGNFYAESFAVFAGKQYHVPMHRLLTGFKRKIVDHINGNTLDNKLENLRFCTTSQNNQNRKSRSPRKSSKFKGVSWSKAANKWAAVIKVDKKQKHIGAFENEIDAARAYDEASRKYHGEHGRTNFKTDEGQGSLAVLPE